MVFYTETELKRAINAERCFDFSLLSFYAIIHSTNDDEYFPWFARAVLTRALQFTSSN
jgi:hypothetical protein